MPRVAGQHDEFDDDFDDSDDPLPEDMDRDDDDGAGDDSSDDFTLPMMMCPNCRRPVAEDTQKCPHCGDWITPVDAKSRGPAKWFFIIAVVLMLLAMLPFVLH